MRIVNGKINGFIGENKIYIGRANHKLKLKGSLLSNPYPITSCRIDWKTSQRLRRESIVSIIGFNSKQFDDNLCRANGIDVITTYDLLEEIRLVAFGSTRWEDTPEGHNYSLDAIAKANGMTKTGHGALAPQLWQEGKHQEVIDYCVNDVKLTVELLNLGLKGKLINPNGGRYLKLRPL